MSFRFLYPLLDRAGGFSFSAALSTFTAGMAKRAGSVFAAAPIVQGESDATGTGDVVSVARGSQISGSFYENFDGNGWWFFTDWTPEFDYDVGAGKVYLLYASSSHYLAYDFDNARYELCVGTQTMTASSNIAAGTMYALVAGGDCNNKLDGTNYGRISINDSHTFGITTQPTASAPDATIYIGSNSGIGACNGIPEGAVVTRLAPFDGTYGIDIGAGDIIAAHYASGSGADVAETICSWDTLLSVPTNASTGELVTGEGEAWSHPHSSAVLTDTFCQTTYGSSAWSTKGTPSTAPADLADADKIFNWGYDWTCDADEEGVEQSLTGLSAGQSYVLRCLAHVSDANDLRIRVTDDTNTGDILTHEFGASSDRDAPGVAIITWELPTIARNGAASDCTAMTIAVEGTAASQQVTLHQCEVQENLIDNPSMETGSGDPWIPDGWSVHGSPGAGELALDTDEHSGVYCLQAASLASFAGIKQDIAIGAGSYVSFGGFGRRTGATPRIYLDTAKQSSDSNTTAYSTLSGDVWTNYPMVARGGAALHTMYAYAASANTSGRWDDIYAFVLDPVSLTVTPASEENSEEGNGLLVDGYDLLTQPIPAGTLKATSGTIEFSWTPRHGADDFYEFSDGAGDPYVARFYRDGVNAIDLRLHTNTVIDMVVAVGGEFVFSTGWNASGLIEAGTRYTVRITYDDTHVKAYFNNVLRLTASPVGGVDFGEKIPDIAYFGGYVTGRVGDAVFG